MLILPAIDLRGGRCVRLRQGDYAQETIFGDDPAAMGRRWVEAGAEFLHLVDLDGAKEGRPVNGESVRSIVATSGVPCQIGGGIRTEADIDTAFSWGVQRVIIGTKAIHDPIWLAQITRRHPGRIVLGLDARDGMVATEGWLSVSEQAALDVARRFAELPLAAIVYTDIRKDGMLAGPDLDGLLRMAHGVPTPIIASGGVTTVADIHAVREIGVYGCIIGRALYEDRLTLADALVAARG